MCRNEGRPCSRRFGRLSWRARDGQIRSAADIDVLPAVISLHQENERVGAVVDIEEFTPRLPSAPQNDFAVSVGLGNVHLAIRAGSTCDDFKLKLSPKP